MLSGYVSMTINPDETEPMLTLHRDFLPYAGYAAIAAANYSYATKHCYIAVTRSTERQIAHRQSAQSRPG